MTVIVSDSITQSRRTTSNRQPATVRTSATNPLRIAEIPVPMSNGTIGITLCPGKAGPSAFGVPWARDIATDFNVISAWRPSALVTLMEPAELVAAGVDGAIGPAAAALGTDWYHLPIRDGECPSLAFEQRWSWVGIRLRTLLRQGQRVLVHCRGGLGRAGTIAARLLAELGVVQTEAIALVRDRRPGAIETEMQAAHVLGIGAIPIAEDLRRSRVAGSLLGGAIGDALGYRVEFDSLERIKSKFGNNGVTDPLTNGTAIVSDDTQMTLFSLEAILLAVPHHETAIVDAAQTAYIDWYRTQTEPSVLRTGQPARLTDFPELYACRAPGNTCMVALSKLLHGRRDAMKNNSKGCGTVMRSAPFGMFPQLFSPADAYRLAAACSRLTHGHPSATAAAGATAHLVRNLMDCYSIEDALDAVLEHLAGVVGAKEVVGALHQARASAALEKPLMGIDQHAAIIGGIGSDPARVGLSRGWVAEEALAVAVYACLVAPDFESAIRVAANHHGDSDSTAAVCGNLWGAIHGVGTMCLLQIFAVDVLRPIEWMLTHAFERYGAEASLASFANSYGCTSREARDGVDRSFSD